MATQDLGKRLAKKQKRAKAKAVRKVTKAQGKAAVAKIEGYDSVKGKRRSTAGDISTARTRTVNKGPKTVSTSVRGGDKNVTIKKKSTTTMSGAGATGGRSGSSSDSGSSSSSRSMQKQKQSGSTKRKMQPTPTPKQPTPNPGLDVGQGRPPIPAGRLNKRLQERNKRESEGFGGSSMKTGGMVNPNMKAMSDAAKDAYKSNKMRRNMPRGY